MNYASISSFGSNAQSEVNNPLTYCINNNMDQRFLHGSHSDTYGQNSRSCQLFLADYCANKWDGFCEVASKNTTAWVPNNITGACSSNGAVACKGLNLGETLIRNTAARKYLFKMLGAKKVFEPFDPTVPNSPMISYYQSSSSASMSASPIVPIYVVNPKTIDTDIVMNKILAKPSIASDILINIYNSMKRFDTLKELKGTKLGLFFSIMPFFKSQGGLGI